MSARVSVRNRCKASFRSAGQVYDNVHLLNLGTDGCRIEVPISPLARISGDSVLEGWALIHPLLPAAAIEAKVVWAHHDIDTRPGFLEAEVQFLGASDEYRNHLQKCLASL
jgi:hypothetical protein